MKKNLLENELVNASSTTRIEELTLCGTKGFNAKDGNFLGKQVFDLTYSGSKTITWNGGSVSIPDQLAVQLVNNYHKSSNTIILENESSYDQQFSAALGASFTGVTYSGSLDSNYLYHGNLFSQSNEKYSLNVHVRNLLNFERVNSKLNISFKSALDGLPANEDKTKYYAFFDDYGTHYLENGSLGGKLIMETAVQKDLLKTVSEQDISIAIEGAYNKMLVGANLKTELLYNYNSVISDHKNSFSFELVSEGGNYYEGITLQEWIASCRKNPSILFNTPELASTISSLMPLSVFIQDNDKVKTFNNMLVQYIGGAEFEDGIIAGPSEIDSNHVMPSKHSAGFLVSTIATQDGGSRGYVNGFDEKIEDPVVKRVTASQHYDWGADTLLPYASSAMPVVQGSHFLSNLIITAYNPSATNWFYGFWEADQTILGDYQDLITEKKESGIAPSDGFIVSYVDWNQEDGARSYVKGSVKLDGKLKPIAAASQHRNWGSGIIVPCNSFCMPVRKGKEYSVEFTKTAYSPINKTYFVPIVNEAIQLGSFATRRENVIHTAANDGFLISYINAKNNGNRGHIKVYADASYSIVSEKSFPIASTSVHFYTNDDRWVPFNSIFVPITKGQNYQVVLTNTSGTCEVTTTWVPILKS